MISEKQRKHIDKLANMSRGKISPLRGRKLDHPSPIKGRKMPSRTLEQKKRMSEAQKLYFSTHVGHRKGKKNSEKTKFAISLANKGNRYRRGGKHTDEAKQKMSKAHIGKPHLNRRGSKSNFWKGGISTINTLIRSSAEYINWRKSVFERDNYTCQECKNRSKYKNRVYLVAHHIKDFSKYPEFRFELNNGITYCKDCHKETDNYGEKCKKKDYENRI